MFSQTWRQVLSKNRTPIIENWLKGKERETVRERIGQRMGVECHNLNWKVTGNSF